MDDSETVWVEREYVGHGFRDDDLSRLRTERVVFEERDFRGANLTESEHAGSAFRNCTFDRAILHHSTFRQCSLLGSVFTDCRMRPLSLLECDFTLAVLGGCDLWGAASWSAHHSSFGPSGGEPPINQVDWGVDGFSPEGGSGMISDANPALGGPFAARWAGNYWDVEYQFC